MPTRQPHPQPLAGDTPAPNDAEREHVILVDIHDNAIGTAEKLSAHVSGALHRAVSVLIWDDAGRMLLQQRADDKYHSPGLWTNTCCGHPRPGEAAVDAATRRLRDEMGFGCQLEALGRITYRATFENGLTEHEIVHVFRGRYNDVVTANPAEAKAYAWRTLDDVRSDIATGPERYSYWFREYVAAKWPTVMAPPTAQA